MYEVYLERAAERDLKQLSKNKAVFQRIVRQLKLLPDNPRPQGSRKLEGSKNDWRIRMGDYRILYEIDDRAKTVKIMRVRHRREAYRSS